MTLFSVFSSLLLVTLTSATATYVDRSSESSSTSAPVIPTPIYLDLVPSYSDLPDCAVGPLSNIVRNMWSGCGDGSQLTSFSCFCTDSYNRFSWEISTAVVGNCQDVHDQREDLATSAVKVFHEYCTSGPEQLVTATVEVVSSIPASATASSAIDIYAARAGEGNGIPAQTQASSAAAATRRYIPIAAAVTSYFSVIISINLW